MSIVWTMRVAVLKQVPLTCCQESLVHPVVRLYLCYIIVRYSFKKKKNKKLGWDTLHLCPLNFILISLFCFEFWFWLSYSTYTLFLFSKTNSFCSGFLFPLRDKCERRRYMLFPSFFPPWSLYFSSALYLECSPLTSDVCTVSLLTSFKLSLALGSNLTFSMRWPSLTTCLILHPPSSASISFCSPFYFTTLNTI